MCVCVCVHTKKQTHLVLELKNTSYAKGKCLELFRLEVHDSKTARTYSLVDGFIRKEWANRKNWACMTRTLLSVSLLPSNRKDWDPRGTPGLGSNEESLFDATGFQGLSTCCLCFQSSLTKSLVYYNSHVDSPNQRTHSQWMYYDLLINSSSQWIEVKVEVKWSEVKVAQSCRISVSLCDPMDYLVHRILQPRILEWVAVPFSRGSSNLGMEPRSPAAQADSSPAEPPGKPTSCQCTESNGILLCSLIVSCYRSFPLSPNNSGHTSPNPGSGLWKSRSEPRPWWPYKPHPPRHPLIARQSLTPLSKTLLQTHVLFSPSIQTLGSFEGRRRIYLSAKYSINVSRNEWIKQSMEIEIGAYQ